MIPKFRQASNQEEYRNAIRELIAHLDDSHARVIFESSQPNYLPVKISNIDNQAVISAYFNDSIAHLNNLKMGDIIVEINGLNIQDEKDRLAKYYSGSNANAKSESIYYDLLKGESNTVALTVKRADETLSLTANRYAPDDFNFYDNPKALKSKVINNDIGYMDMANIKAKDLLEILDSFQDKKAIIIDLRNYPEFIYSLFGRYLNSESRAFSSTFRPYILYPGRFSKPKNISMRGGKSTFKGKVIILVNSESVSRAEFTAMAFQTADNAITIGNQTTGADGDVSVFQYMGGYTTTMSGNGIAYPDGTESQRKGVKIDILVKPTIAGLRKGIDEVLAKAIEIASN